MPNPKLRFYFREPTIDTNIPITDGTVKIEGFDWEFVDNEDDADAWDCGFAARVRAYAKGLPHISIPAFPNRKFRLAYIFVNSKAGIESPRDLEGKRVGIMQWDNTAGVWARGALQHYYGVDLTRINWLAARVKKEGVAQGIRIEKLEGRGDADAMFHIVTLKQEFVDRHPDAPVALLKSFRASRDEAFNRLEGPDPQVILYSWMAAAVNEQRELMGENYWAYNIENNRRVLEAITQYAHEQGLSPTRIDYKRFFSPQAAALPGV